MDNCSDCDNGCALRKMSRESDVSDRKSYISITDSDSMDDSDVESQYDDYYKKHDTKVAHNRKEMVQNIKELKNRKERSFKQIDKFDLSRSLYEAILYPEKSKGFKFPAPFQTLSYSFQQKNSFYVKTNELGIFKYLI